VLVYVIWRTRSLSAVLALAAGALPAILALGAYHWAAFGNPFHTGYTYSANSYAEQQREGFYGIGAPDPDTIYRILLTRHGLLAATPILVLAAAGLVLLWRAGRRPEAVVCSATSIAFLLTNSGYFEPYGGASPGPRFFAVALPFLAVGLAPAFARWPRLTAAAAVFSIAAMSLDASTMSFSLSALGSVDLTETIWSLAGAPRLAGLAIGWAATAGVVVLAGRLLFGVPELTSATPLAAPAGPA
jgi:hypothetical protein